MAVQHYPVERRQCPEFYQERLTQVGGLNPFGEPNFKLAWAQTETTRQGGEWEAEGEWFKGYRDVYLGDGLPHWMLMQWAAPGKNVQMPHLVAEGPTRFYLDNKCQKTGLQLLGEYPYRGSYQIVLPLVAKWFENGQMIIRGFPLSREIIEMMVPVIKASMEVSLDIKVRFMQDEREQDDVEYGKNIEAAYEDAKLSRAAQSSKWIEDKVRAMEKIYSSASAAITRMHRDKVFQSHHAV